MNNYLWKLKSQKTLFLMRLKVQDKTKMTNKAKLLYIKGKNQSNKMKNIFIIVKKQKIKKKTFLNSII